LRIAILSDIHGNRTAFEAVLKDVRDMAPDLVLQGGDLADSGSGPAEIVDQIRELGWQGVLGNTDEILTRPDSLGEFAGQSTAPASIWTAVREMADFTGELLGEERISWMRCLPRMQIHDSLALVHASPDNLWRSPAPESSDAELEQTFAALGNELVVFGHIHRPFIPRVQHRIFANSGSVGMPHDGDPRSAYLLVDGGEPKIRRVEYDVEKEIRALADSGLPHADWVIRTIRAGSPQTP
jgi:predicted phosphodiesterase